MERLRLEGVWRDSILFTSLDQCSMTLGRHTIKRLCVCVCVCVCVREKDSVCASVCQLWVLEWCCEVFHMLTQMTDELLFLNTTQVDLASEERNHTKEPEKERREMRVEEERRGE